AGTEAGSRRLRRIALQPTPIPHDLRMSPLAGRHRPGRIHTTRRRTVLAAQPPERGALGMLVFEEAQLVAALAVEGGELLVGRAPDCAVRVRDPELSRRHCLISRQGEATRLQDLGSANGTFLHGRRVASAELRGGDVVTLGQVLLKFVPLGSAEWRAHCALFEQIYTDELTGLLNRRGFRLRSEALLATLEQDAPIGLLAI